MRTILELLKKDFHAKQEKNPSYSLRAYARYLDISPTSLSLFLSNKRGLSSKNEDKIVDKLGLGKESVSSDTFTELDLAKLNVLSDWHYFAILSLLETEDYQDCPRWIASRLNISVEAAQEALETLTKLNFIKKENGKHLYTGVQLKTPHNVRSFAIRHSHHQALDLAKASLEIDDIHLRDFSAVTVATTPEKIEQASQYIKEFRRKLMKFLESEDKTEVYRLSIQLFPLSRRQSC